MDLQFPRGGHSGSRLCNKAGHVYARCIRGAQVTFMQQTPGHVYGTERTRLWDGIGQVEAEGLDGGAGPVCGTGLGWEGF